MFWCFASESIIGDSVDTECSALLMLTLLDIFACFF